MGFFGLFKKPTIIQDDFFGKLRYINFKGSKGYFEGKGFFSPTSSETEYLIEADVSGPLEGQKEFYKSLQTSFNNYIEKIKPLIEDEFRNWKEDFEIREFNKEFALVCITIPKLNTPLIWNMAFTSIHDRNHHITIDFRDHEPNGILIDG